MEKRNIRAKGKSTEGNKNTGRKSEDSRQKKAVIVGCAAAIAAGMVLLTIFSAAMSAGKVPIWAVKGIGLILGCRLPALEHSFVQDTQSKNGFFLGIENFFGGPPQSAGILFAAGMLGSLAIGETPGFWALVKLFSMLLCGCLCGSIGVNLKQRKKGF